MIIQTPLNIPKLQKFLRKWYWKHGQALTFDTFEVRTTDSCAYDVCLWDPKKKEPVKFMFTIENYHCMKECAWRPAYGTIVHERDMIEIFDSVVASYLPFYFDQNFFIRTWKPLKTADIERCARFFIDNVLDMKYRIWNIRVNDHEEMDLKKEMEKQNGRADPNNQQG